MCIYLRRFHVPHPVPPGQLGRSWHHQTAPGWIKTAVPTRIGANPFHPTEVAISVKVDMVDQSLFRACFAASNMPERHQEAFFLRIPCHVSLEHQKRDETWHQLIFSPPSCEPICVTVM